MIGSLAFDGAAGNAIRLWVRNRQARTAITGDSTRPGAVARCGRELSELRPKTSRPGLLCTLAEGLGPTYITNRDQNEGLLPQPVSAGSNTRAVHETIHRCHCCHRAFKYPIPFAEHQVRSQHDSLLLLMSLVGCRSPKTRTVEPIFGTRLYFRPSGVVVGCLLSQSCMAWISDC
jgi:hypothetical protein